MGRNDNSRNLTNLFVREVDFLDERLSDLYANEIEQYSINQDVYDYYLAIARLNQQTGTLFDSLPYEISSNIANPEDPDELVIGFFETASINRSIFTIRGNEHPVGVNGDQPYFEFCILYTFTTDSAYLYGYTMLIQEPQSQFEPYIFMKPECVDCNNFGSEDLRNS